MTTKKKRQTSPAGRRMATVALSLCLLAGVTLFGMYTVGKTEEQQRRLEQEVADAEKAAQARQQTAKTADTLAGNGWVTFSGTGALTATTGAALTGGLDGTVQSAAYSAYLSAIEPYAFDVMIYDGAESTVQSAMMAFIRRIADEAGVPVYRDDSVAALLVMLNAGETIPKELYQIVAAIYAEVVYTANDMRKK